jgi:acetyl esterase/lipase
VSKTPGSIKLLFYVPKSYKARPSIGSLSPNSSKPWKGYPILIDFHGGGFSIGKASDDARWATAVAEHNSPSNDAVVISVSYRLAPEYPFPTAIEDCASAILWIWSHGTSLGLDVTRTALSGFSAGGNLSLTVPIYLHDILSAQKTAASKNPQGKIVAIAAFYPSTNWTQTRTERNASNPHLIRMAPDSIFDFFDASYLYPPPADRSGPLFSPGLASDTLLREALPDRIGMITCGGDQLLAEGEAFRKRLKGLGKRVDGHVVEAVSHAWDKKPTFGRGDEKRDAAYRVMVESVQNAWGMRTD